MGDAQTAALDDLRDRIGNSTERAVLHHITDVLKVMDERLRSQAKAIEELQARPIDEDVADLESRLSDVEQGLDFVAEDISSMIKERLEEIERRLEGGAGAFLEECVKEADEHLQASWSLSEGEQKRAHERSALYYTVEAVREIVDKNAGISAARNLREHVEEVEQKVDDTDELVGDVLERLYAVEEEVGAPLTGPSNHDYADAHATYDILQLVEDEVPGGMPTVDEIATWDIETRRKVEDWADATHFAVSDRHDVDVPPVPEVLQDEEHDSRERHIEMLRQIGENLGEVPLEQLLYDVFGEENITDVQYPTADEPFRFTMDNTLVDYGNDPEWRFEVHFREGGSIQVKRTSPLSGNVMEPVESVAAGVIEHALNQALSNDSTS